MSRKVLVSLIFITTYLFVFDSVVRAEEISIENSGNGAGSTNEVAIETVRETKVESTSNANVQNEVQVEANTGENTVNANVGGGSLETGNIAVDVEIRNDVNKASVEVEICCCGGCNISAVNSKNGANSQNSISLSVGNSVSVEDYKSANIQNSVAVNPNTGGNTVAGNVGEVNLKTGDIDVSVTIGTKANENQVSIHCGGPEEPEGSEEPSESEEPTGGPEEPESEPEEEVFEDGEEPSEDGESAKPYEDPRPGPIFDSGEVLAAATEYIAGQVLPYTGPSEWTYALTFLLFLLAHYSRRLSYRYLYN